MNFRAVIFDLDGVIVCTDRFHYQAWKETVEGLGISFDEEMNNRLRGVGRMESLEILLEYGGNRSFSREEKEKLAEQKNEIYRGLLAAMTPDDVTEEVRDTLAEIRRRGYGGNPPSRMSPPRRSPRFSFHRRFQLRSRLPRPPLPDNPPVFRPAAPPLLKTAAIGGAVTCGKADYRLERLGDLLGILDPVAGLSGDARKEQDRRQN